MSRAPSTGPPGTADVVVVGGGVIGSAVARSLAAGNVATCVVDREEIPGAATWASAGMLSPIGEGLRKGPFLELGLRGLRAYPGLVAELKEETGVDVGYHPSGKVQVALAEEGAESLRERAAWGARQGFQTRWISRDELRRELPELTHRARGGLLIPEDHQVENRALGPALRTAAQRKGAQWVPGREVRRVLIRKGSVEGVELSDGSRITSSTIVLAAGAWSGGIAGLPRPLPVRPVRGQMVALHPASPVSTAMVGSPSLYLVPRRDGRLLAGATMEEVGFESHPTAGGVARMLEGAMELFPSLAHARLAESWAGLRPGTPDALPVLGPDPEVRGLLYATGHFRNGILLAPVTAQIISGLVLYGDPGVELAPFRPHRFAASQAHRR